MERAAVKARPLPASSASPSAKPQHHTPCTCQGKCSHCRDSNAAVTAALQTPGQPLDPASRAFLGPRLDFDLSNIRIHDDASAGKAAASIDAHAWTLGRDIFFKPGMYAPRDRLRAGLLAHELAHVGQHAAGATSPIPSPAARVAPHHAYDEHAHDEHTRDEHARAEQDADRFAATLAAGFRPGALAPAGEPRIHRSVASKLLDVALFIPRLFGLETFTADDLREYLAGLKKRKGIEDSLFSDNKARACVTRETEFGPYDTQTKIWLVQEMSTGHVSSFDEGAILTLLRRSPAERGQIIAAVGRETLLGLFTGSNHRILDALSMTAADAGTGLIERLRKLDPSELADYAANATDPAVKESVRQATALANITAPVPQGATISQTGEAGLTINGVAITVLPDQFDPAVAPHAFTKAQFSTSTPGKIVVTPENSANPMGEILPPKISVKIWTVFASEESKSGTPGYGVGTRPEDQHTLQTHERAHGTAWFQFLREHVPPEFRVTHPMLPDAYNAEVDRWEAAFRAWEREANDFTLRAGDCTGKLPTDEQLAGTGYTAAICQQP